MSKILFILDYYYPKPSANVICAKKVMDTLKLDNEVICLTSDNSRDVLTKEIHDGIEIWRTKKRLQYCFVEFCNQRIKNGNHFYKFVKLVGRCVIKIKNILYSPVWPIVTFNGISRFTSVAEKIIKEKNIDTIVAVSFPYESLIALCNIKRRYKDIRCLGYFLDVTSIGQIGASGISRKVSIWSSLKLESKVVKLLDGCIILENAKELYFKNHKEYKHKLIVSDIPLIENHERTKLIEKENCKIKIVYTGSIQKDVRDPSKFIEVLSRLPSELISKIEIDFYGKSGGIFDGWGDEKLEKFNVKLFGQVSEEEADEAIKTADCLLSLGNEDKYLIPSKVFKYINTQNRIIHIACTEDDPCIKYLEFYSKSLILCKDNMTNVGMDKLISFIFNNDKQHVQDSDNEKLFPRCTPNYTAQIIQNK